MRISFDKGHGSDTGRWLSVSFGQGSGYTRKWWQNLNAGPGLARGPGAYGSGNCGHKGLTHCNSAFCGRSWCNAQRWPLFGFLFVVGHTFRLWCGPTYGRGLKAWRVGLRGLLRSRRVHGSDCYSPVSFR